MINFRTPTFTLRNAATSFLFFSLLVSCDNRRVFEEYREFDDRTWKVSDQPRFEFTIVDATQPYNLYYNIRNSLSYPYARIFVTYHLYDSTDRELSTRLINSDLFDQKTGQPLGESGLGDLYDHQFALLRHQRFPFPGRYSLKVDQFMRQDTLQGVIAVGVRVEKDADGQGIGPQH